MGYIVYPCATLRRFATKKVVISCKEIALEGLWRGVLLRYCRFEGFPEIQSNDQATIIICMAGAWNV